ncbi:MAG: methyltransferase domain-containing protein [Acidobacteria bacterium]|nr:methyltransferase domain-containing protein [Acidobacteriota bacterium]
MPSSGNREILDLGGISEANVQFLSGHGGKIHTVDLIDCYDSGAASASAERYSLEAAHGFVDRYLNFARTQFDAILAWDSLEFLDSDALHMTVPRLAEILRPGGVLLAFFHTQARGETVPLHRYSIQGVDELALAPRKERSMPNTFNNRSLERLFQDFDSVKFFLTRDNLREVIVTR